jgi:hypothetical protein
MSDEPAPEPQYSGKYRLRSLEEILAPYADPETWRWQLEEMEDSELKQLFSERLQRLEAERPSPEDAIKLMLAHGGDSSSEKAEKPAEKAGMGDFDAIGDAVRRWSGPNPMRIMLAPMSYAETLAVYGDTSSYYKDLPPPNILKVISGGQTGADRAALDWAIERGIEHGGYCPQGRIAEDGVIPERYNLTETQETESSARTFRNVEESDAIVIITLADGLRGGSREIARHAREAGKRCIHLSLADRFDSSAALRGFAKAEAIRVLNVAGSREGEEPGIYEFTQTLLRRAFPHKAGDANQ